MTRQGVFEDDISYSKCFILCLKKKTKEGRKNGTSILSVSPKRGEAGLRGDYTKEELED